MADVDLDRDHTVDPGEDFFRHANGGWLSLHSIPQDAGSLDTFREVALRVEDLLYEQLLRAVDSPSDSIEKMLGDYFAAGMDLVARDSARRAPIRDILGDIQDASSSGDVVSLLPMLHRNGIRVLWWPEVVASHVAGHGHLLWVLPGELGLPDRRWYFGKDSTTKALREEYVAYIAAQLRNAGVPSASAALQAPEVFALECRLAEGRLSEVDRCRVHLADNRKSVAELDAISAAVGFSEYFAGLGVGHVECVNVPEPAYLEAVAAVIETTDIDTLRSFLVFNVVQRLNDALHSEVFEAHFAFYGRRIRGQRRPGALSRRVMAALNSDLGEALSRLYIRTAFSPSARDQAAELASEILAEMRTSIQTRTWMGDATRERALAKLDSVQVRIGHPEAWRDWSGIEISRDSYAGNRLAAARFDMSAKLDKLNKPRDVREWGVPAHSVNACFNPLQNAVQVPAGLLQPPIFLLDGDDAWNYGALGCVIGHELIHAFDDHGRFLDAQGRVCDWWTADDSTSFVQLAEQLVEQFDDFPVIDDSRVSGRLTLGENIADIGGLALASRALARVSAVGGHDGDPLDRQFFFAYATLFRGIMTEELTRMRAGTDVHSPYEWRVRGPLSNLDAFQAAFGLPEGVPALRPSRRRIEIW